MFKRGDKVAIFGALTDRPDWIGLEGIVWDWPEHVFNAYGENGVWIHPLAPRPDGEGYRPFGWSAENVQKVS